MIVGGVGASFTLGSFSAIGCSTKADAETTGAKPKAAGVAFIPNVFLRVDPDGMVTVTVNRSDMGQGVRTSFAVLVADEMDADWHKVRVIQAPADPKYGGQGTGGSSSIRGMNEELRKVGASARMMLIAAAAKAWAVDPSTNKTENGKVIHTASGRTIGYGELTSAANGMAVPSGGDVKLKDKSEFKIIGKGVTRVDNPDVVTGKAMYGIDVKVDNMKYAVLARNATFGAMLQTVDDADARKVPGVVDVIKLNNMVAVVADNTWAALKGREALKLTWDPGPNAAVTSDTIRDGLRAAIGQHPEMPAGKVVTAAYDFPYIAHATMEPMNAVADVRSDSCTVWAGTQTPDSAQNQVARTLGIPESSVTINVMLLGGGFGRRLGNDYIGQAVQISKAAKCPIKLTWTREDDMRHDNYRPMSHHDMKGVVDSSGKAAAWSHWGVQADPRGGGEGHSGPAGIPYDIPNATMNMTSGHSPISNGAWRSVEHTFQDPVNECFIDEMAHAAGKDPFEFRRDLIKDARLKKVLETAAEKAGWGSPLPAGSGRGIACFVGYGSAIAHVIEVTVKGDEIKVNRVVACVDPGIAVNPKGIEAQIQGACSDSLSMALFAAINIENGGAKEGNWTDYRWMQIDSMPKVEVHIVEGSDTMGGMGEVGIPSVIPACANAIFAATGKRARKFPIKVSELV